MFRPRVIPVLLLDDKGLVKTIRFAEPTYVGDPINAVRIFNDAEADELVFLDISATREGRLPPFDLIEQIAEAAYMPFAVGGGFRKAEDAARAFDVGADKVVVNTGALEDPTLINDIARVFGSQAVVASIDARHDDAGAYEAFGRNGTMATGFTPAEVAIRAEDAGAGEILINSIDRDGTLEGYDLALIQTVSRAVTVPVIGCGGAAGYDDLPKPYFEAGASAVAAGSLFVFVGKKRAVLINYPMQDELSELFHT